MSLPNLEPYQYEPLADEIRLLFVRWAKSSDDLVCGIYHTKLGAVDYTAISYTWDQGPDSYVGGPVDIPLIDVQNVMVEGGDLDGQAAMLFSENPRRYLRVTRSMRDLLLSIGDIGEPDAVYGSFFWIDQISINQLDNKEKSAQVRMMHHIYERARKTIVYLGEPIFNTDLAFEVAYALAALDNVDEDKIPLKRGLFDDDPTLDWAAVKEISTYTEQYCDLLRPSPQTHFFVFGVDLLGRTWFDRTWVIQEIVCSREAEIRIGKLKMSWDLLASACRVCRKFGFDQRFPSNSHASSVATIEQLRQAFRVFTPTTSSPSSDRTSSEMIEICWSMKIRSISRVLPIVLFKGATEPRDKVFAIFNIITEPDLCYTIDEGLSFIDYDLPLRTVYLKACELWNKGSTYSIFKSPLSGQSSHELSFLDWVLNFEHNRTTDLPSWVPRWTREDSGEQMVLFLGVAGWKAGMVEAGETSKCHVAFPSPDQYTLNEVPLTVRGLNLFQIQRTCEAMRQDASFAEHADAISQFSDPYPTTSLTYLEAFILAIYPESSNYEIRSSRFWDFVSVARHGTSDQTQAGRTRLTEKEIMCALPGKVRFPEFSYPCFARRRLFVVTDNGFIGLAPEQSRRGDKIVLLFGGRSPYVLRELSAGKYQFIGSCVFFGVMNGEAMDGYPADRVEDFVLI